MEAHGYIFKGHAGKVSPDYFPSLIGSVPGTTNGNTDDVYFDLIAVPDRTVLKIIISKWCAYDNGQDQVSDRILQVQSPTGSYYIPQKELYEIAAFHHDDDTIALIEALPVARG